MKMTSITGNDIKLHKYESFLYFLLWTGAVLYSIYSVFLINTCKNLNIYFMYKFCIYNKLFIL